MLTVTAMVDWRRRPILILTLGYFAGRYTVIQNVESRVFSKLQTFFLHCLRALENASSIKMFSRTIGANVPVRPVVEPITKHRTTRHLGCQVRGQTVANTTSKNVLNTRHST